MEKKIDHKTSRYHNETIKTFPYCDWKKSIPAINMETWKPELIGSCKKFLRWYNNVDFVPTLETMWNFFTLYHHKDIDMLKLGGAFQTRLVFVYTNLQKQKCISSKNRRRPVGENSRRCCWWYFYRVNTQNSCWRNFSLKVYKHMQINRGDWW